MCVYVCVVFVSVSVHVRVYKIKIYHRSGAFNCVCACVHKVKCWYIQWTFKFDDLIQIDKHLVWQIDKGLPKTYYHILLKIIVAVT